MDSVLLVYEEKGYFYTNRDNAGYCVICGRNVLKFSSNGRDTSAHMFFIWVDMVELENLFWNMAY